MQNIAVTWILSLMTFLAPPEKLAAAPQFPGWEETAEEKHARYESIATDLWEVVYAPENKPAFYSGKRQRGETAAVMLAVAFMESGFAKDVDKGPCYREGKWFLRCDGGLSAGLMQLRLGADVTNMSSHGTEGYVQQDVFADRHLQFFIGLHMIRKSFKACAKYPADWGLNVYASGKCVEKMADGTEVPKGLVESKKRLELARRLLARGPVPLDAEVPVPTRGPTQRQAPRPPAPETQPSGPQS